MGEFPYCDLRIATVKNSLLSLINGSTGGRLIWGVLAHPYVSLVGPILMQTELNTPKPCALSFVGEAMAQAAEIAALEARSLELEYRLEDLLDVIPDQNGPVGEYRQKLSELADVYQQLARNYKAMAGI